MILRNELWSIFTKGQKLQLAALTQVGVEAIDPRRS